MNPVTMAEIDAARGDVECLLKMLREWKGPDTRPVSDEEIARARAEVERLLAGWWEQGCREVPPAPLLVCHGDPPARTCGVIGPHRVSDCPVLAGTSEAAITDEFFAPRTPTGDAERSA